MVHGMLWSSRMLRRIAELLPEHRVLLIDLRGHGRSSKPTDPSLYGWSRFASDVVALLDHLDLERAVVGGLSLGANVTLATGNEHPDRVAAMVPEMPVLDRAEGFGRPVFGGLARAFERTGPALASLTDLISRVPVPASVPELAALRDVLSVEPEVGAAVVRGLLSDDLVFARLDPERMSMPTLVIGHRGDPLHVLEDARDLVEMLPNARLDERFSIMDYRLRTDLLADTLTEFLSEVANRR
jgi:pimeloyl-ACP methyl ester carboxylesterase